MNKSKFKRSGKHLGSKYLGQIIDENRPEFGTNNLILAPVGSGKSHFIKHSLSKGKIGTMLMLVSNTYLREDLVPKNLKIRKEQQSALWTTKSKATYNDEENDIHVMTYAEFGRRILVNDDFVKDIDTIFCDEIHSLLDYRNYNLDPALVIATRYLFNKQEGKTMYYFTATDKSIVDFDKRNPGTLRDVKTFDYRGEKEIIRHANALEKSIDHLSALDGELKKVNHDVKNHIEKSAFETTVDNTADLRDELIELEGDFIELGLKGFGYSQTIQQMKNMEFILSDYGFNVLTLWSVNNNEEQMSEEQLRAREELIETNVIPAPYNFLLINSSMREGWDLLDNDVELIIINTSNPTDIIQARGRVRKNVMKVIYRSGTNENSDIVIPEEYMNVNLNKEAKDKLSKQLNIMDNRGRQMKWTTVRRKAEEAGYEVKDKRAMVDGKRQMVSIITKK